MRVAAKMFLWAFFLLPLSFCALGNELSWVDKGRYFELEEENPITSVVAEAYKRTTKDYACFWEGERIKGDFVKKFSPILSRSIVKRFFENHEDCLNVAVARYGFEPADDPKQWGDKYALIKIYKQKTTKDFSIVEVRFWSTLNKKEPPLTQDHGGAIVTLIEEQGTWKISNIESVSSLRAEGFRALMEDQPIFSDPEWRNKDYSKSLINPEPYKEDQGQK